MRSSFSIRSFRGDNSCFVDYHMRGRGKGSGDMEFTRRMAATAIGACPLAASSCVPSYSDYTFC